MVTELLMKYFWLVQTLSRAGQDGLSLEDIQERWEKRWNERYSRRSFNNHRLAIEDGFGIRIGCNKSNYRYYIAGQGDSSEDDRLNWLMDSVTASNINELRKSQLKGRIALESVPKGRNHLLVITGAMQENLKIRIAYQKYSSKEESDYTIHPYALKENSRRWYLVGFCEERGGIRVYALDRIRTISTLLEGFDMPEGFDVDELFAGCFGVYLPDQGARMRRIIFRTTSEEAKYLKDLPVHESQRMLEDDGVHATFRIDVYPNRNLLMDFLSRGSSLEVVEPEDIRAQIAAELAQAAGLYWVE